jgi:hypothetical protein
MSILQQYLENTLGAAAAEFAIGKASEVPSPFEDDMSRSWTPYGVVRSAAQAVGLASEESEGEGSTTSSQLSGVGQESTLTGIEAWLSDRIKQVMDVPTKLNPLTGTQRATGLPKIMGPALGPIGLLSAVGGALSQANLEKIFEEAKKGTPGYGVGLLDNQMVGYSPGMLSELGFGPVMSGMVDNVPPGLTAAQHQQNIIDALAAVDYSNLDVIPDITAAYNIASYGAVEGANVGMGSLASEGVVYSYTQNPYGAGMIKTPVTSGSGNFVTGSNSPWAGYGPSDVDFDPGFGYTDAADVLGTKSDTAFFDDELDVTPTSSYDQPPGIGPTSIGDNSSNNASDNTSNNSSSGPTGSMGSTSMGSNSGMSGPGDMGRDDDDGGHTGGGAADGSEADTGGGYGALGHAVGGRVGMQNGGTAVTEGFVNKDPNSVSDDMSIADNRYTSVKAGSFVVNQPANEKNKKMLDKVVGEATKRTKMKKGGKTSMVDVALSDGERLIEPEVVATIEKKYGKGFLDKINDEGKPEVKRRQAKYGEKIGAALGGGFLADQGMELGDVGEDIDMEEYLPVSDELKAKLSKFANRKPQRGQIKQFIRSLSPEDKLTVLFLTETQSTTDPIESMEAIGEVVKNRMDSDYYDFKNLKTLDDVLLKQIAKNKSFQFSGLEPTTFYDRAVEVKEGLADKGLAKAAAAAQNVLDPETEGVQRLPANTLFYTRKDAPSQWMRESKKLEFSTELGGHEFYRTFAAPELP